MIKETRDLQVETLKFSHHCVKFDAYRSHDIT